MTKLGTILSPRFFLIMAMLLSSLVFSSPSFADDLCPELEDETSIFGHILSCVLDVFYDAVGKAFTPVATFMNPVIGAMLMLAILIFGIKVLGRGAGWGEALGFLMRIGIMLMFFSQLSTILSATLQMQGQLVQWTSGTDALNQIDEILAVLIGFGGKLTIASGLVGILSGAMLSSAFGFTLFFFGVKAILDVVFFVIQALFVYLTAYIVLLFMVVISPLVVPMAIFNYTERYAMSWVKICVAAMLTPMFLMIALTGFIGPIKGAVQDVFTAIGVEGDVFSTGKERDFAVFARSQEAPFAWLMPADANLTQQISGGRELQNPPIPSYLNPNMRFGYSTAPFDTSGLSFGLNTVEIVKKVLIALAKLMVLTYLVRSLVDQMPIIASGIAGGGHGIFNMRPTAIEGEIKKMVGDAEKKLKGSGKE